jgi:FkbM family methyltransferase
LLAILGITVKSLVCVEMNPDTFRRLQFNLARNFESDLTLVNAAVCGQRRTFHLALGRGSTGDSIYQDCGVPGERRLPIEGLLLDDVCQRAFKGDRQNFDLCKIDVEGAEYEILSSPGHECLRRCRWLMVEIHERSDLEKTAALLSHITDLGFVQTGQRDDVFAFENRAGVVKGSG